MEPQDCHGPAKRALGGTKGLGPQDPGERVGTPREMDPDLPGSVQESPGEAWVGGGLLQAWGC